MPEDTAALRREQLRRERQAEYQAYLRTKQQQSAPIAASHFGFSSTTSSDSTSSSSLAERRRLLAKEREQELTSYNAQLDMGYNGHRPDSNSLRGRVENNDVTMRAGEYSYSNKDEVSGSAAERQSSAMRYDKLKQQRLEEERKYGSQFEGALYPPRPVENRGRWEGREREDRQKQVHFDNHAGEAHRRMRWDEEEEGLLQWVKGQGKARDFDTRKSQATTPPPYTNNKGMVGSRSPLASGIAGSITTLGAGDDKATKRRKQKEYAEQLQAQIREKQEQKWLERHQDNKQNKMISRLSGQGPLKTKESRPPIRDSKQNAEYGYPQGSNHVISQLPPNGVYPAFPPQWPNYYYAGYPYHPPPPPPPMLPPNGHPFQTSSSHLPPSMYGFYQPPYIQPLPSGQLESKRIVGDTKEEREWLRSLKDSSGEQGEESDSFFSSSTGETSLKMNKASYRAQLLEQIKERKLKKKEQTRREQVEHEKGSAVYDPFGKGGCGAPIRDKRGKLVTDLKHMKKVNDERMMFGLASITPLPGDIAEGGGIGVLDDSLTEHISPRFVMPYDVKKNKQLQDKADQSVYREALERQIQEKAQLKRKEQEIKVQEERTEAERIEREVKQLEEKYREEKEREKERQYELKVRNEALKHEREEKRREEKERKQEEDWREQERIKKEVEERKKQLLIQNMEKELPSPDHIRSNSPPIPALRNKAAIQLDSSPPSVPLQPQWQSRHHDPSPVQQTGDEQSSANDIFPQATQPRTASPPVPTLRHKLVIQEQSNANAGPISPPTAQLSGEHNTHLQPSTDLPLPAPSLAPMVPTAPSESSLESQSQPQHKKPLSGDGMEKILKNVRNMRRKLEGERRKIYTQMPEFPAGDQKASSTPSSAVSSGPNFMKPRLVAPRRNSIASKPASEAYPAGNAYGSLPNSSNYRHTGQERELHHRRQWQKEPFIVPFEFQSTAGDRAVPYTSTVAGVAEKENVIPTRRTDVDTNCTRVPPRNPGSWQPTDFWLKSGGSGSRHSSGRPRPPSPGGQSRFSEDLDVDAIQQRNRERQHRLNVILDSIKQSLPEDSTHRSNASSRNTYSRSAAVSTTHPYPLAPEHPRSSLSAHLGPCPRIVDRARPPKKGYELEGDDNYYYSQS